MFVLVFTIIFCDHIKGWFQVSNFLKIDKAIMSHWYQNLDDKLIREFLEIVLKSLDSGLTYKS